MKNLILSFTNSFLESVRIMNQLTLTPHSVAIQNVAIAGSGISNIAALLAEAFVNHEIKVPLKVNNGFRIPAFVNEHTLFIANSFSGTTEETLEQVRRAKQRNAKIVCITTGGTLLEYAKEHQLDYIRIPSSGVQSRKISLAYHVFLSMATMQKAGLISDGYINSVLQTQRHLNANTKHIQEAAEALALQIPDAFLFIYGSVKIESVVLRAQQQINEHAKVLCHANYFPEMLHNEIEAWTNQAQIALKHGAVLLLRHSYEHPLTQKGISLFQQILDRQGVPVHSITAVGASYMEQCFYLIHYFDWLAYRLAEEKGIKSDEIPTITMLKEQIK